MMATVHHVTSGLGLRQFQAAQFLSDRAYIAIFRNVTPMLNVDPHYCYPSTEWHVV